MNEKHISLNGEWLLYYMLEDKHMQNSLDYLREHGKCIAATVPGNVELDLVRAGIEPDPFYGENIYRFRKYEFYRWQFERQFHAPDNNGSRWVLVFDGLNCFADIYLNDQKVGDSDNALIAHEFDVTDMLTYGKQNKISVRIRSAINEARKMDNEAYAFSWEIGEFNMLRMPPSSFGWDIMGRFISAGMWRGVRLEERKPTRFTDLYYATMGIDTDGTAHLRLQYQWETDEPILDGFYIRLHAACGDHVITTEKYAYFTRGSMYIDVKNARLWWPKGYGEAALYNMTLTLEKDGQVLDKRVDRVGIRVVHIDHVLKAGDEGEFKVFVNHCPIMCKGSNWVPLDAMHSRDAQRLQKAHDLFEEMGCNIIRCWGGNVYEDHAFFDLCDERGMMVWQDFAMACAAYPQNEAYCEKIRKEATAVVKKLRNHASILLWAGDNEVDEVLSAQEYPDIMNRYNVLTRKVLPDVIRSHDPFRVFIPSSPYILEGKRGENMPEQHTWGVRAYFKSDYYKNSTAHFISECGYSGCANVASLRTFIPEKDMENWVNNPVWITHSTEHRPFSYEINYTSVQRMYDQAKIMFDSVPSNIEDFCKLSQISQAEAMKFFVERTRCQKWRRTGIIWWNLIEGWPQCDDNSTVDYYYRKKLVFYYLKRVHQPVCIMMNELEGWEREVILSNDTRHDCLVKYRIYDGDTGTVYMEGERVSPANENVSLGFIAELAGEKKLYMIHWEIEGKEYGNHYITGYPKYSSKQMLDWVDKIASLPEPFNWNTQEE